MATGNTTLVDLQIAISEFLVVWREPLAQTVLRRATADNGALATAKSKSVLAVAL